MLQRLQAHKRLLVLIRYVIKGQHLRYVIWLIVCIILTTTACNDQAVVSDVDLVAAEINGRDLFSAPSIEKGPAEIILSFNQAVSIDDVQERIELMPSVSYEIRTLQQGTKVVLEMTLTSEDSYRLTLQKGPIASLAELRRSYDFNFQVADQSSFCSGASANCLDTLMVTSGGLTKGIPFYSSLPLEQVGGQDSAIELLLIGVHGLNRNYNEYYNFITAGLIHSEETERVLWACPQFPEEEDPAFFHWPSSGWREGQNSIGLFSLSSFEVVDRLVTKVIESGQFPNLQKVVITGHSSGGLFTHLYAAANDMETEFPSLRFHYLTSNSQYYYYPDERRVRRTGGVPQLYVPGDCSGYDIWPLGYRLVPFYLTTVPKESFNQRFLERRITYFEGSGNAADPSLNTTDCSAVLLGSSRFERGLNIYDYMELVYADQHAHSFIEVPGIGHNAQGMYASDAFSNWIRAVVGN